MLDVISRSCEQLIELTNKLGFSKVVLPRPGCGAGELNYYQDVQPILQKLDGRFYVITFK